MQNLTWEDESLVIEHFKLLLQMEICHTQLEEFMLYFHAPVRELECFSVKQRLKTELGSPEYSIACCIHQLPPPTKPSWKIRKIIRKKRKTIALLSSTISPNWNQAVKTCWLHPHNRETEGKGRTRTISILPPTSSYSSHNSPGLFALTATESPSCPDTAWLKLPQQQGLWLFGLTQPSMVP